MPVPVKTARLIFQAPVLRWLTLLGCLGVATAACLMGPSPVRSGAARQAEPLAWVRTRHGWQRPTWQQPPPHQSRLHPAVVAAFVVLASVLALCAFAPGKTVDPDLQSISKPCFRVVTAPMSGRKTAK